MQTDLAQKLVVKTTVQQILRKRFRNEMNIKYPMQFNPLFQLTFRLNVDLNFLFVTKKIKMCFKCPVHIVPVYLLIGNMFI